MADAPRVDWRFAALCAAILDVLFTIQLWVSQFPNLSFGLALARQTVTSSPSPPLRLPAGCRHPFSETESRGRWLVRQILTGGAFSIVHSIAAASFRSLPQLAAADNIVDAIITSLLTRGNPRAVRCAIVAVHAVASPMARSNAHRPQTRADLPSQART